MIIPGRTEGLFPQFCLNPRGSQLIGVTGAEPVVDFGSLVLLDVYIDMMEPNHEVLNFTAPCVETKTRCFLRLYMERQ